MTAPTSRSASATPSLCSRAPHPAARPRSGHYPIGLFDPSIRRAVGTGIRKGDRRPSRARLPRPPSGCRLCGQGIPAGRGYRSPTKRGDQVRGGARPAPLKGRVRVRDLAPAPRGVNASGGRSHGTYASLLRDGSSVACSAPSEASAGAEERRERRRWREPVTNPRTVCDPAQVDARAGSRCGPGPVP